MIDEDLAWRAFEQRDRTRDGEFVGAVRTTGIYCKPSCPARRPLRHNVSFFVDGAQAREAGFRPCLRCRPDEVSREAAAIEQARALLASDEPPVLDALAAAVGYAPHHFQRLFKRATGLSPAAYARAQRLKRAQDLLKKGAGVTETIYEAGYQAPSRFYAEVGGQLGMTPSAWRDGGKGETIRYAIAETVLGPMLLAATEKGICRLSFDEDEGALRRRFPKARIEAGGEGLRTLVERAVAACADPAGASDLPLDVGGTAFQQRVWHELRRIPPGETRSYAAIAAAAGNPGAVRAAGSANGANNVAILIPCHRAIRSDGSLGGYAYGLERKRKLLAAEEKGRR